MKVKILSQWLLRTLLMLAGVAGVFLALPYYAASARPLAITYDCASEQSQIPSSQCEVLVALFHSTTGTGWTNKTNWLQTSMPCNWFGVVCSGSTVTSLSLHANNLAGPLPAGLGNLTGLTNLDLSSNQLTSNIPSGLSSLTGLTNLDLSTNHLAGPIPTGLGGLVNLIHLDLNGNALTGSIPTQFGGLLDLQLLDLSSNELSGSIPKQLGYIMPLQFLYLDDNQLTGSIPVLLGSLNSLTRLNLSDNLLSGSLPVELGNLTNLTRLNLENNLFSGSLPTQLGNLTNLTDLYLGSNQLTGEIPSTFLAFDGTLVNLSLSCGLTAYDDPNDPADVADFIETLLGPNWDVECLINDDFNDATGISDTHTFLLDTSLATKANDDPTLPCVSDAGTNSVWYSYTSTSPKRLTLSTLTSDYDTMLAVWTGSRGSLVNVACNDDSGGMQSQLTIHVNANQTYYIEVVGYQASGNLVFNATVSDPPTATITRTPTITLTPSITPTPTITLTPSITPTKTPPTTTSVTFTSNGAQDGWVLEAGEYGNVGGSRDYRSVNLLLGDDGMNGQYASILSFTTGSLPNTAVITKVTLTVTRDKFVGGLEPVALFQGFVVDINKGFFDTAAGLQITDFQAPPSKSYGPFSPKLISKTYSFDLTSAKAYINKLSTNSALTQIRLRFKWEDNDNDAANTLNIFSGNATLDSTRPKLIIRYYVP